MRRNVLLLGATGLVGREILDLLLSDDSVSRVVVVARRLPEVEHPKLDPVVIDLGEMNEAASRFNVDQVFCALGTTIRKAGSEERFRVVDYEYPLEAARLAFAAGARHFLLVSSIGSSSDSRFFYNRVKGQLEEAIIASGYRSVTIARPSLLLGKRGEWRTGEQIGKLFSPLMPPAIKPIHARQVARALAESARADEPGLHILESRAMRAAAD